MKLHIRFPQNLITVDLLKQKQIPCLVRISNEFEVIFFDTVPDVSGIVYGWDRDELERRAVASGGGEYTHSARSLITLMREENDIYQIVDLKMFYRSFGWCAVVKNGQYADPGKFWDDDIL
ncbi:hypothetical protein [Delftia lacustris]|jgi:hypothetical protein|uniref:hypothetical protein n=1 Tax=Delftia lacustris TaxID=558537 RepID=UPI000944FB3C